MLDFKGIAGIFEEIELLLIRSLKRNIGRHKQEEKQEKFQWTAWQAEKLRNLDKFRKENAAIMNEYTDLIDSETRQLMEEQFKEGVNGVTAPQFETISDTPQVTMSLEPKFFGVDNTKVTKLIDDVVNLEKHAETAALRTMDDVYRQTVNKAQLAMSTGMPLQKAIDMSVKDFLDKGINCIVYRDGRRVNIADYVRMALRTTSTRSELQGESERFRAMGYDTVQVTKYSMCSDTCLPWQGKAYINDVFVMWDGEVEERENGELWGKSNYCGKWFPLLSTAIHAGLFHPNCRHSIKLYTDGDSLPKALDNSEIEKRYKLEQKLRRLENNVRKAKRRAEGFSDPDNIKKANKELREAQKKVRKFIDQVNSEYGKIILKRDSDGREKIYDGEVYSSVPSGTPVNAPSDTEGKAVEIAVEASETVQDAYRDEKIPERFADKEITIPITNKTQDYRPIQFNKEDEMKVNRASEITLHRVDTAVNNVYISDNVKIKPKKLHEIDRNITEVFDKMRISDKDNLPPVLVVSSEDMATSAVASYNARRNVLFINEKYSVYDKANVPEIMEQLTCGENDLSSYIHEIYHWIDAEKFRKRFGAVTDENYSEYLDFINKNALEKLDKLKKKGYNITVSKYAHDSIMRNMFYEVYTEFRTAVLLGGDE